MAMITGGELVVRTLRIAGVETIFGLHGAHIDTIFQAALDHGLPIIDTRHEAAAGHAAEGYARTANRLGVALVTAGGGFTNCLTPIANAYFDRTPVLFITGSGMLRQSETNTLQAGIDQVAVATPITKWAHRIVATDQIPRLLAQAIRIATSGPRGPVLLDIPWDVLMAEVDETTITMPRIEIGAAGPRPHDGLIGTMLDRLAGAERPAICVGSEVLRGHGRDALHRFAGRTGIPVFADYEGGGLLAGLGDHSGGFIQNLFTFKDRAPDVILMLGLRFGLHTWHESGLIISHGASVIQVDPDSRELGRLQHVAMAVMADPAATLAALDAAAAARDWPDRHTWRATVGAIIGARIAAIAARAHDRTPLHPWHAVNAIADQVDADTIVVADGAESYLWTTEAMHRAQPSTFLTHGYLGSMGVGLGNALGAQQAAPDKRVMLIVGDGAIGFSIAEFDSLVRHRLPVIVIILNNRSWAATLHYQQFVAGANRITNTRLDNGAYHDVAKAFGAAAWQVQTLAELRAALAAAKAQTLAACIDVRVDLDAIPPEVMVLMGQDPFAEQQGAAT